MGPGKLPELALLAALISAAFLPLCVPPPAAAQQQQQQQGPPAPQPGSPGGDAAALLTLRNASTNWGEFAAANGVGGWDEATPLCRQARAPGSVAGSLYKWRRERGPGARAAMLCMQMRHAALDPRPPSRPLCLAARSWTGVTCNMNGRAASVTLQCESCRAQLRGRLTPELAEVRGGRRIEGCVVLQCESCRARLRGRLR